MGDGSEGFQDTLAAPGQTALFRFNKDTDLDGYSDRSEERLGTDAEDAASFPRPELIAGAHSISSGNLVTATLSLLNTGLYDAYGVEAVMIAPDDTINITNNTVGGSGRVRAQKQVIVGSRILAQTPLPAAWTQDGHAQPAPGGYYTGNTDRTYTFTVQSCGVGGCDVGAGTWVLHWDDGAGASGDLPFGDGYDSPGLLAVGAFGLKLGLLSGKVYNGDSFTVNALTPRDTFQYTIAEGHEDDFTPPIVLVSYNDPQGNHRFVVPPAAMSLSLPTDDLMAYSGQMLQDPGVEIVTSGPFAAGANTTDLVVNNPTETGLTGAHLFLEFIDPEGTVALEVPVTADLPAGPTAVPVSWSTDDFSPAYSAEQDYIVMAFWTDYQGNILDTAARPLSSFQEDPKPAFAMASEDETWDFGAAQQGTLMQRQFTLASVGYGDLLTHLSDATGISVAGPASEPLVPGDTAAYTVTLNTQYLPVGAFTETLEVRTDDPANPMKTITISGEVTPMPEDAPGGVTIRPLDMPVTVSGNQGDWVEFTHTLGPDPATLHPVKVYSQDYATLWGVGKYAPDFGQGTASYDMFGDGRDGDLVIASGETVQINSVRTSVSGTVTAGQRIIPVMNTTGLSAGDEVLLLQTQGLTVGNYEFVRLQSVGSGSIVSESDLRHTYGEFSVGDWRGPLVGQYFSNPNLSGSPTYTQSDSNLWFVWGDQAPAGLPSDGFSIRWTGQFDFPGNDSYTFQVRAKDGVRIYLDGTLVFDEWHTVDGTGRMYSPALSVSAGLHTFVIEYCNISGWAEMMFSLFSDYHSAQVVRVPNYQNVLIESDGTLTSIPWGGSAGGVLAFRSRGATVVDGVISASGKGYRGGAAGTGNGNPGSSAEGNLFPSWRGPYNNLNGGGGGVSYDATDGGGGGHSTAGGTGAGNGSNPGGAGGTVVGISDLTSLVLGGGGGAGGYACCWYVGGDGGAGGGIIYVASNELTVNGSVTANGLNGVAKDSPGSGGGGAGGTVFLRAREGTVGVGKVTATGGAGYNGGGNGGLGRIRVEYCEDLVGTTNPSTTPVKLTCYVTEQIESVPYNRARLTLPDAGINTYQMQYGRRYVFTDTLQLMQSIRMPKQLYATSTMDALVSNSGVSSGDLSLSLDIGDDGTADWTFNDTTTFPVSFTLSSLANALNAYMVEQAGAAWGADIDVPVRMTINRQADVILTNLVLTLQSNQPSVLTAAAVDLGADRPLDVAVEVTGIHGMGEAWQYDHSLGPDAQSLHPVRVYSHDYAVQHGVGKYGTAASNLTWSYGEFGDGNMGDLTVPPGDTVYTDEWRTAINGASLAGQKAVTVNNASGLNVGDEILIMQMQGPGVGDYEFGTVAGSSNGTIILENDLIHGYGPPIGQSCNGGFLGEYFSNQTLSGSPTVTRCDSAINFNWPEGVSPATGIPADHFSVRWTGDFFFRAGQHAFQMLADDGVRLYVDNQLVIDRWVDQSGVHYVGSRILSEGVHSIRVEYYENTGSGKAELRFQDRAQVLRVPHYKNVTILSGGILTAHGWDGSTGGIVAFRSSGTTTIDGTLTADYLGYRGNLSISNASKLGYVGEGTSGENRVQSSASYGNAGGGGPYAGSGEVCCEGTGGGGGGNGTAGGRGYSDGDSGRQQIGGYGGGISGNPELSNMTFGGSGGEPTATRTTVDKPSLAAGLVAGSSTWQAAMSCSLAL